MVTAIALFDAALRALANCGELPPLTAHINSSCFDWLTLRRLLIRAARVL